MSIKHEGLPTVGDSYRPGVYMLTGINGTGKSTIVDRIAVERPKIVPIHASLELSKLFNGISREEMEKLSAEEKLGRMVAHFTTTFERSLDANKTVIMDTHLLVPIRKEDDLNYEDIWSDEYSQYTEAMVMLTASPDTIRGWRLRDEALTGRKRSTEVIDIAADQDANTARFSELVAEGSLPSRSQVVENVDGGLADVQRMVEAVFISDKN